jgi:hypothetical protein
MAIFKNPRPLDPSLLPEPVFPENPLFVDLYWQTWQYAWDNVVERACIPQSPYMDEAFDPDTIWIWDTCLMAHFCKFAPRLFPGVESFNNFYQPLYDGTETALMIQHLDNPPLFAWSELEYLHFTGDLQRAQWLLKAGYLQKHFTFFESPLRDRFLPHGRVLLSLERQPMGYLWNGCSNGMDNTPRGGWPEQPDNEANIYWLDAAAQQALSARSIARLAALCGDAATQEEYQGHYLALQALLNDHYWDPAEGFYFDLLAEPPFAKAKVRTPASYWPMLAEICTSQQAQALAEKVLDPDWFGGSVPWTSVARQEPSYQPRGMYWRGGVWLPVAYIGAKALQKYGYLEIAHTAAYQLVEHMARTYEQYEPHSIWECYNPERPEPSTGKDNQYIVRPDFCGWSALGPISLFIEAVLGFHSIDALKKTVKWQRFRPGLYGIRRLRFGEIITSIVGDERTVQVESNLPYTLEVNGKAYAIQAGKNGIDIE